MFLWISIIFWSMFLWSTRHNLYLRDDAEMLQQEYRILASLQSLERFHKMVLLAIGLWLSKICDLLRNKK